MRLRPSPALVIAVLALLLAAGGGAFAAVRSTGNPVNIVDGTTATNVAKVSSSGSLQVSGAVTASPASAASFLHAAAFTITGGSGCRTVMVPPTGKAMIVTAVEVDTFVDPSPGPDNNLVVATGDCATPVADVNPTAVGPTVVALGPGVAIPAGSQLSAYAGGGVEAEVYAFGYAVSSSSVPPVAESGHTGPPPQ